MTLCEIFQAPLQPATPTTSSVAHQNFCSFLLLCCLLSNYSRDTFSKKKSISKFEKKFTHKKVPLLYGEKSSFCSGVFQNSLHLVYIWFHHNKRIPLYNTEKNSSFVDVFWKKIYNLFYKNKNPHRIKQEFVHNLDFIEYYYQILYNKMNCFNLILLIFLLYLTIYSIHFLECIKVCLIFNPSCTFLSVPWN